MVKIGKMIVCRQLMLWMLGIIILVPTIVQGFEITAKVDKTKISIEDTVYLQVVVKGGKATLDLSDIQDFTIHSRGTSSSYHFINGQTEQKTIYQFLLIPLAEGFLTIPPIRAEIGGQINQTHPIQIEVLKTVIDPNQVKPLFAQTEISEPILYVGQQAVLTIKFYSSKNLAGVGFETRPDFKEINAKPFDSEKTYSQQIKGRTYRVTQLDYLIIPSSAGSVTIDPVRFVAKERIIIRQDPFRDSFFSTGQYKTYRVMSNSLNFDVKPLPEVPDNGEFSGLVGQFKITATLDKNKLKVSESATLTIQVSGSGNIMDSALPSVNLDQNGFKIYDDTPVDAIRITEKGYQGSRTFKKAIVPVKAGIFKIEPVNLLFFDVENKKYQTAKSNELTLEVQESAISATVPAVSAGPAGRKSEKEDVSLINKDIFDIRDDLSVLKDYRPLSPKTFILLFFLPWLIPIGIKLFISIKSKDAGDDRVMFEKAKRHIKLAAKNKNKKEVFLGHLYTALTSVVLSVGKKKSETLTLQEARSIFEQAEIEKSIQKKVLALIQQIESVRFGGHKLDEQRADQMFVDIKKIIKTLGFICIFIIYGAVLPHAGSANVTSDFSEGISLYKNGRYLDSARAFERVAEIPVRNPKLYYNIGNAYLKAKDIGRAILWYERAKLLSPDDPDLFYNLEYANTFVKDRKEKQVDYMEILFIWDKIIDLKTLQQIVISISLLFVIWIVVRMMKREQVFSGTGLFLTVLLLIGTGLAGMGYYKQFYSNKAVILEENVSIRSGTSDSATILFSLHSGSLVKIREKQDRYFKIEFSPDRIGWVDSQEIGIVKGNGV